MVDADGDLAGILTITDIDRAQAEHPGADLTVGQACSSDLLVACPDETFGAALRRMGARDVGRLPVVARDQPRRLLGLLRRSDLVRACETALTRRAQQVRLGAVGSVDVEEFVVASGALAAGRRLRTIAWPSDCLVASARRGRQVLLPHGNTLIQARDVLAVAVEGDARQVVRQLCRTMPGPTLF